MKRLRLSVHWREPVEMSLDDEACARLEAALGLRVHRLDGLGAHTVAHRFVADSASGSTVLQLVRDDEGDLTIELVSFGAVEVNAAERADLHKAVEKVLAGQFPSRPREIIAGLAVIAAVITAMQWLLIPALPAIQNDLGATPLSISWLQTAFLLSGAISAPLFSSIGDVHGRRATLVAVLCVTMGGSVICGLADSLGPLIAGRVLQGVATAAFPLAYGIVRDELPQERIATAMGMIVGPFSISMCLGPILSGVVVDSLGYRWLFWLGTAAVAACIAVAVRVIPGSALRTSPRIDWRGALLAALGLSGLLLAITRSSAWGWLDARSLGLLAASALMLSAWAVVDEREERPLLELRATRGRAVWTTNLVGFLCGAGTFAVFMLIPQLAQAPEGAGFGFGASVTATALLLLPLIVMMVVTGVLAGHFVSQIGVRPLLIAGAATAAAASLLLLVAHDSRGPVYVACAGLGIGIGCLGSPIATLIVGVVSANRVGAALAVNSFARTVGSAIGGAGASALLGSHAVLETGGGFDDGVILMIATFAAAMVAAIAIPGGRSAVARGEAASASAPTAAGERQSDREWVSVF